VLTVWRALKMLFSRQLWSITVVLSFMWVSESHVIERERYLQSDYGMCRAPAVAALAGATP
jgi:hypothetical protein